MWEKNNGDDENSILQNQFTAYLMTAVQNRKIAYLRKQSQMMQSEFSVELQANSLEIAVEIDFLLDLVLMQQLENKSLYFALRKAKERERYIFLSKVLDDRSFTQLAEELGISYGAVAMAYYRVVERIKKAMEGDEK